jgi:hypothetical protein
VKVNMYIVRERLPKELDNRKEESAFLFFMPTCAGPFYKTKRRR